MKTQIRHKFLTMRNALEIQACEAFGAAIRLNFKGFCLSALTEKDVVMAYASFQKEADTWGIIEDLRERGNTVLLPRTQKAGLEALEYRGPESLVRNRFGILDPDPDRCPPGDLSAVTLALVPGVAFDRQGGRIGFGAGYYDRFLPKIPAAKKVGLCYETQISGCLPTEETDIPMDFLLTEKGLFNCKTQSYTGL